MSALWRRRWRAPACPARAAAGGASGTWLRPADDAGRARRLIILHDWQQAHLRRAAYARLQCWACMASVRGMA